MPRKRTRGFGGGFSHVPPITTHFNLSLDDATPTAGDILTLTVTAKDSSMQTVTDYAGTVHLTSSDAAAVLGGDSTLVSGVGTFSVQLKTAGSKTVTARDTVASSVAGQATAVVAAAAATKVLYAQQPTNVASAQSITPSPTVRITDAYGNTRTADTANVVLSLHSGSTGVLSGTLTRAAVAGIATFPGLSIDAIGSKQIDADSAGLTQAVSSAFTVALSPATKLLFVQQPTGIVEDRVIDPPVTVRVVDAGNNTVTASTATVALALHTGSTGVLGGDVSNAAVAGIATFSDLTVTLSGSKQIDATSAGLTTAVSSAFTVTASTPTHLAFFVQPSNVVAGSAIFPFVVVYVLDAEDFVVDDNTTEVTLALTTPGAATLSGTLTKTATEGICTFTDLTVDVVDDYTLTATASGLTDAVSSSFSVTIAPATRLLFVQQPTDTAAADSISPAVTARIVDAFGNTHIEDDTTEIEVLIVATTGAILPGSFTATVVDGVATFATLATDSAGAYYLKARTAGLVGADSDGFDILAGDATHLAFLRQPTVVVVGTVISPTVTVGVMDVFGNVVLADNSTDVTVALADLSGTLTRTAVAGVATFDDLAIASTGTVTLTATSAPLTLATSDTFYVIPVPYLWVASYQEVYQNASLTIPAVLQDAPIAGWKDRSGNDRHFILSDPLSKATFHLGVQNGLPTVHTDGLTQYIAVSIGTGQGSTFTLCAVLRFNSGADGNRVWSGYDSAGATLKHTTTDTVQMGNGVPGGTIDLTIPDGVFCCIQANYAFHAGRGRVNSTAYVDGDGTMGNQSPAGFCLGANYPGGGNFPTDCDFGEFLAFQANLDDSEMDATKAYLEAVWSGVPSLLIDDSADTIVDDAGDSILLAPAGDTIA